MNSTTFNKFISDNSSYNNFEIGNGPILGDFDNISDYLATDISSVKIEYKKLDPFVTVLPDSFFDSEDDDIDDEKFQKAIAYFREKWNWNISVHVIGRLEVLIHPFPILRDIGKSS